MAPRPIRSLALFVVAALLAGCSLNLDALSAATSRPPTPTASASVAASASATPSASITPAPSATATSAWEVVVFDRPEPPAAIEAAVVGGPGIVAVGMAGGHGAVWTRAPDEAWVRVEKTPAPNDAEVTQLTDVAAADFGLVAIGFAGAPQGEPGATIVWFSRDGASWKEVERIPGVLLQGVAAGGPGIIAVGGKGPAVGFPHAVSAWTTTDGSTWKQASEAEARPNTGMYDVSRSAAGFVAVGVEREESGDLRGASWTSTDGTSWKRTADGDVFDASAMRAVASGGPGLVAVGQDYAREGARPAAWTSADGVTWERQLIQGQEGSVVALTAVRGPLAAIGSIDTDGSSTPAVWTSRNGRRWTAQPAITDGTAGTLHVVVTFEGRVVAFGRVRGTEPNDSQPLVIRGPVGVP